jgi:hypothetical protein
VLELPFGWVQVKDALNCRASFNSAVEPLALQAVLIKLDMDCFFVLASALKRGDQFDRTMF